MSSTATPPRRTAGGATGFPPSRLPQSDGWESLGRSNSDGRNESGLSSDTWNCVPDAGETGFPPSPLPQSDVWESLGRSNSDGRNESGLSSDAWNCVPPPCGEGREGVPG